MSRSLRTNIQWEAQIFEDKDDEYNLLEDCVFPIDRDKVYDKYWEEMYRNQY